MSLEVFRAQAQWCEDMEELKKKTIKDITLEEAASSTDFEGFTNRELNLWQHREFLYGMNYQVSQMLEQFNEMKNKKELREDQFKMLVKYCLGQYQLISPKANEVSNEINKLLQERGKAEEKTTFIQKIKKIFH